MKEQPSALCRLKSPIRVGEFGWIIPLNVKTRTNPAHNHPVLTFKRMDDL